MALKLKIKLNEVDDAQTYFKYIDDNTNLPAADQYGQSGNPARSSLGLFLYVTKKEVGDDVDSEIYGGTNNSDPENAVDWQITYIEDNWYEAVLIAGNDYVGGNTYGVNDIVYYSTRLWMSLQAANSGNQPDNSPAWWMDVTDDKDNIIDNGTASTFYTVEKNDALYNKAATNYAQSVAENTKNGVCKACDHEDMDKLNRIHLHLQGVGVADYQQLFTQAQWNIESLKTLCAT